MSNAMPLVSAIITTWNGERHLREAIDSTLMQDYPALEVIVVDDGSTDATQTICRSYGERIRYVRQPKDDKHGATAYVRAVAEARGTYVAPLDHDDRWVRGKIARQVQALEGRPDAAIVFTRFRMIDDAGADWGVSGAVDLSGDAFHLLLESNRFCHASAMYRRDVIEAVGGLDVEIGCGDWDLWLRVARDHPIMMLDEVLTEYRVHPGGYSRDPRRMEEVHKRVIRNQRGRWHTPDCAGCRRASARGIRTATHPYVARFHAMARAGGREGLLEAFVTALRKAPAVMLAPRNLVTTGKSLWLFARHRAKGPAPDGAR